MTLRSTTEDQTKKKTKTKNELLGSEQHTQGLHAHLLPPSPPTRPRVGQNIRAGGSVPGGSSRARLCAFRSLRNSQQPPGEKHKGGFRPAHLEIGSREWASAPLFVAGRES